MPFYDNILLPECIINAAFTGSLCIFLFTVLLRWHAPSVLHHSSQISGTIMSLGWHNIEGTRPESLIISWYLAGWSPWRPRHSPNGSAFHVLRQLGQDMKLLYSCCLNLLFPSQSLQYQRSNIPTPSNDHPLVQFWVSVSNPDLWPGII